jgi:hypothetical protein
VSSNSAAYRQILDIITEGSTKTVDQLSE